MAAEIHPSAESKWDKAFWERAALTADSDPADHGWIRPVVDRGCQEVPSEEMTNRSRARSGSFSHAPCRDIMA
ncbi:hypothetical protein VTN31DRAFT_6023 [Thermomyces dupontii]|uniref:uncharacterized protein n=1 Tax=Talaromyces thermophilus TaxID=28565 RepID=UPI00374300B0